MLQYTAHQQLHQVTEAVLTEDPRTTYRILDLGCGTGLCGPLFKPMASTLIGIDLSEKMIAQAAQKGAAQDGRHQQEARAAPGDARAQGRVCRAPQQDD